MSLSPLLSVRLSFSLPPTPVCVSIFLSFPSYLSFHSCLCIYLSLLHSCQCYYLSLSPHSCLYFYLSLSHPVFLSLLHSCLCLYLSLSLCNHSCLRFYLCLHSYLSFSVWLSLSICLTLPSCISVYLSFFNPCLFFNLFSLCGSLSH